MCAARNVGCVLALCGALAGQACGTRSEPAGGVTPAAGNTEPVPDAGEPASDADESGRDTATAALQPPPTPPDLPDAENAMSSLGGDETPGSCPPDPRPTHCVLLELQGPTTAGIAALVERLRGEGLDAGTEGDAVTILMDDEAITRVFGARVEYQSAAMSATMGTSCEAVLEGGRVPRAWRDDVRGFGLGYQICE